MIVVSRYCPRVFLGSDSWSRLFAIAAGIVVDRDFTLVFFEHWSGFLQAGNHCSGQICFLDITACSDRFRQKILDLTAFFLIFFNVYQIGITHDLTAIHTFKKGDLTKPSLSQLIVHICQYRVPPPPPTSTPSFGENS